MKLQVCCAKQPLLSRTLLRNPEFIGLFSKRALTFCWAYLPLGANPQPNELPFCVWWMGHATHMNGERETHNWNDTHRSQVISHTWTIQGTHMCVDIYVWYDVYIALSMLHHVAHKVRLAPKSVLFLTMVWCSALIWWCDIMCTYASCSACMCATRCSIYVQRDVVYMCDMVYVCDVQ